MEPRVHSKYTMNNDTLYCDDPCDDVTHWIGHI